MKRILLAAALVLLCVGTAPGVRGQTAEVFRPADVRIVSAVWGTGEIFIDVTGRVREVLNEPDRAFAVGADWLKYDPVVGTTKVLVTVFEYDDERFILNVPEGGQTGVAALRDCVRNRSLKPPAGPPLVGKTPPRTAEELIAFMAGTTWDLGLEGEAPNNTVTFYRNGTFKFRNEGNVGNWVVEGPAAMRFFDKDPVTLNRERTRFRAAGDWKAYVGVLRQ